MTTDVWVRALRLDDIPIDEVARWDHGGKTYALYRLAEDEVCATANICTHEHAFLSDGFLESGVIECPRHSGRFNVRSGLPLGPPVCDAVKTFAVRIEDGSIYLNVAAV